MEKEKLIHDIALKMAFQEPISIDPLGTTKEKEYLRKYLTAYRNLEVSYDVVVRELEEQQERLKAFFPKEDQ